MKAALSTGFLALLAAGCSVPSIEFYDAGSASSSGGVVDSSVDGVCQSVSDPPEGGKCCAVGGPVCYGTPCNANQCAKCSCAWPNVCCAKTGKVTCSPAPCP